MIDLHREGKSLDKEERLVTDALQRYSRLSVKPCVDK